MTGAAARLGFPTTQKLPVRGDRFVGIARSIFSERATSHTQPTGRNTEMMKRRAVLMAAAALPIAAPAAAQARNRVAGTWRIVTVTMEAHGTTTFPYGPHPDGRLVFTPDLHFVEFIRDPRIPRFASNERGGGTDAENRAVMAGSLALYGRYTVDGEGRFSGNTVEGSSFPNWIGDVRTTNDLTMEVEGDRMTEQFQRPGGAKVTIIFERL